MLLPTDQPHAMTAVFHPPYMGEVRQERWQSATSIQHTQRRQQTMLRGLLHPAPPRPGAGTWVPRLRSRGATSAGKALVKTRCLFTHTGAPEEDKLSLEIGLRPPAPTAGRQMHAQPETASGTWNQVSPDLIQRSVT